MTTVYPYSFSITITQTHVDQHRDPKYRCRSTCRHCPVANALVEKFPELEADNRDVLSVAPHYYAFAVYNSGLRIGECAYTLPEDLHKAINTYDRTGKFALGTYTITRAPK